MKLTPGDKKAAKKDFHTKKFVHLMLMKLTTGVYFINVLTAAFPCQIQKSAKNSQVITLFDAFRIF